MSSLKQSLNPKAIFLILGILLIALNLRLPFTGIAPVLPWIQKEFNLSTTAIGFLTSLPLIAFAIFSPLSASIAKKFGIERTLFAALMTIAFGILIRSGQSAWMTFSGTLLIGIGIALGNVLLPGLIKRNFHSRAASLTGAYSITMGAGGAIASASVIPLTAAWGWHIALSIFVLAPVLALLVWIPQLKNHETINVSKNNPHSSSAVWKSPLAWQVTLFMGLNAMPFYIAVGWLPTILMNKGLSAAEAGSMHGSLQLATAIPGLILAATLRRMNDQRLAAVVVSLLSAIAFAGFAFAPKFALLWSLILGFGCGASMMLGLTFIVLRTNTTEDAAVLSGMSQCIGYLMAASGPLIFGKLFDLFSDWTVPLLMTSIIAVLGAFSGIMAGRNKHIAHKSNFN